MLRRLLPWLVVAVAIAACALLRLHWIENAPVTQRCLAGAGGIGCALRALAVHLFNGPWLWLAALASSITALCSRRPWVAALAAACGGIALVLYSAEVGAFSLLVGVLRLARCQRDAAATATTRAPTAG